MENLMHYEMTRADVRALPEWKAASARVRVYSIGGDPKNGFIAYVNDAPAYATFGGGDGVARIGDAGERTKQLVGTCRHFTRRAFREWVTARVTEEMLFSR